uniref:Uncharacterized protein n=1 Tax=Caenorhabditis tropicalis TaxID=1561998 RepID=A0A1I7U036_9PELO
MAALFNESLRKVNEQQPPTIIEEDETPKRGKRPSDLEHFKIISEKWRSSCSDDSDDSLPNNLNTSESMTNEEKLKNVMFFVTFPD